MAAKRINNEWFSNYGCPLHLAVWSVQKKLIDDWFQNCEGKNSICVSKKTIKPENPIQGTLGLMVVRGFGIGCSRKRSSQRNLPETKEKQVWLRSVKPESEEFKHGRKGKSRESCFFFQDTMAFCHNGPQTLVDSEKLGNINLDDGDVTFNLEYPRHLSYSQQKCWIWG